MKMSSAMLTNKKCHSHQWLISGFQMWMRAPQTVIQQMLPSPVRHGDHWGTVRMQEARSTRKEDWSQISEVHTKGTNSVSPEAYTFPYCRMLNSLTWYLIFDVQTAYSLFCKLVYSLTSPASRAVLSELLRCCLLGSGYKTFPPNNITLYFQSVTIDCSL